MKNRSIITLITLCALVGVAEAQTVFTTQTSTATGTQTITLNASTSILRFNSASDVDLVGITSTTDGRVLCIVNASASAVVRIHTESASAANTADRIHISANGGSRILFGGIGIAWLTYDGTTQRWRAGLLDQYETPGGYSVNGDLTVNQSIFTWGHLTATGNGSIGGTLAAGNTTLSGTSGTTRLTLKSTSSPGDRSQIGWVDSAAGALWGVGNDAGQSGYHSFYLYDFVNAAYALFFDGSGSGLSSITFGTTFGGMDYDDADEVLMLYASGTYRLWLHEDYLKHNVAPFYTRQASGTAKPTKGSNCNGSSSSSQHADSSDARGSVTTGNGATACTLTFAIPWDIEQSPANGFPICVANSSLAGSVVTISSIDDHSVTFAMSTAGAQTIYYHCDGIIDPP